ncbi:peptidyl-prolyl cis-trans isomerase E-like [Spodoptera litura]|uniref:Peptidyl-prolyl cis-trans isomerase E-like n=1 Tax=Spodoptera litura TaxID=69820 RepID=A0A9J7DZU8_SPOLT|nr:peptidyl-prolyl cis-trans isomerase E-like [Spodoptera litura]
MMLIKKTYFMGGRVDSHWDYEPLRPMQYYQHRVDFLKRTRRENLILYERILTSDARVETTAELNRAWARNRRKIVEQALGTFVLFPPIPCEEIEDLAFVAPPNVKRPRVYIKLGIKEGAVIGELCLELFTDTCPRTCHLFLELLDGDTLGHGYINTCFYRKVPKLYWSGGDVIYNNGFGCYAQRGRVIPIGAENYHFPHSMAGLLSMRVTMDDEMCGIFNITFKPLPQLDLRNVVFGRVVRPSTTYTTMSQMGNALSSRPIIELLSSRRKEAGRWIFGQPNTRLASRSSSFLRKLLLS